MIPESSEFALNPGPVVKAVSESPPLSILSLLHLAPRSHLSHLPGEIHGSDILDQDLLDNIGGRSHLLTVRIHAIADADVLEVDAILGANRR